MTFDAADLPRAWVQCDLLSVSNLNPPLDRCVLNDGIEVNFVPMRAVEAEGGGLVRPEVRSYGEVRKGYTAFLSGDVIMAKITPCMENGKTTVVPALPGDVCFGSTEFIVIRPEQGLDARRIAQFLLQHETRHSALRSMAGGVGQMRVPARFVESLRLPVPPSAEQERIADTLDELFSDLDAAVDALERVRAKLKLYRASVLKASVEGDLTKDWRAQHPGAEPASQLLQRILAERRRRWEDDQLAKHKAKGIAPPPNWRAKYRNPMATTSAERSNVPESWLTVSVDQLLAAPIVNGLSVRGSDHPPGVRALRLSAMSDSGFDYSEVRYLPLETEAVEDIAIMAGDFFVSRGNGSKHLVGRGTLAQEPDTEVIFPDTMMRIRVVEGDILNAWLPTVWPSVLVRRQIEQAVKTTAGILKISQPDLAGITIPIPPLAEQEAIVELVEDQLSVIDHLEADLDAKLKGAQALRQSILRRAFAGKLVPQDPNDEPAAELLKRIAAERASGQAARTAGKRRTPAAKSRPGATAARRRPSR